MKKLLTIAFSLLLILFNLNVALAQSNTVSISLAPENGDYAVGDTISVDVLLNTADVEAQAFIFKIQYPTDLLEVIDQNDEESGIQIEGKLVFDTELTDTDEQVDEEKGIIMYEEWNEGTNTYSTGEDEPAILATIEFKAIAEGEAEIEFIFDDSDPDASGDTNVYDLNIDDVLTEAGGAIFEITAGDGTVAEEEAEEEENTEEEHEEVEIEYSVALRSNRLNLNANGTDEATIYATVTNNDGEFVENMELEIELDGNGVISDDTGITNDNGEIEFTYTAANETGIEIIKVYLKEDKTVSTNLEIELSEVEENNQEEELVTAESIEGPNDQSKTGPSLNLLLFFTVFVLGVYLKKEYAKKRG